LSMDLSILAAPVSILAGTTAAICGFGIGSLLTPLIALTAGTKLAVALVSIPHFVGTTVRCFILRKDINRQVLASFGVTSAFAGLLGALLHNCLNTQSLTLIFGWVLIFAGFMGLTGLAQRIQLKGLVAFIAGMVSGGLGGLVGNQGGIRSAALLGFDLKPKAFVATATAIGVIVDLARMPVYLLSQYQQITESWALLLATSTGVLIGTYVGDSYMQKMNERTFKKIVSALVLALGIFMLMRT